MEKAVFAVMVLCLSVFSFSWTPVSAEETKKIQDNSFLIEEAYNQEPGVIQHIQTFQYYKKSKTWVYTFTQEWPVPKQTHQLSYTIPVLHVHGDTSETGIGDIMLNYRYQLVLKDRLAVAPRFSLILPTGDYKKGLGTDALGYQVNLPVSVELSDKWVSHWNAGVTYTPNSKESGGAKADTFGYNLGGSLIWLASENFNILTEAVWNSAQIVQSDGTKKKGESFFINPGMRFAVNHKSGLQVVPGIGFPIGIGSSNREYGVFLYLSFEHPLF
ncbi:MAG: transporter [Nitrospirae bacterium]|nr:transporter [Nitrospirota bacterium]